MAPVNKTEEVWLRGWRMDGAGLGAQPGLRVSGRAACGGIPDLPLGPLWAQNRRWPAKQEIVFDGARASKQAQHHKPGSRGLVEDMPMAG